jgi:glycosyl transferase family 87
MKSSKLANSIWGVALACLIFLSVQLHPGVKEYVAQGRFDFILYYTAGQIVKEGQVRHLYDYELQREFELSLTGRPYPMPFIHPPFESLLFVPLAFFTYEWAYRIWALVNFLLVGVSAYLLRGYLLNVRRLSLRVVFILAWFIPIWVAILHGQDSILMLLFFALAFLSFKQNQDSKAGLWLGLAMMKFQLVLPFMAVFFVRRRWKLVVSFVLVALLLGVVSLGLVGWGGVQDWVHLIRRENENLPVGREVLERNIVPLAMPNVRGCLFALLAGSVAPGILNLTDGVCSALLLIWGITRWSRKDESDERGIELLFALNLVVALLVSYHLNVHDLALIGLPILIVFNCFETQKTSGSLQFGRGVLRARSGGEPLTSSGSLRRLVITGSALLLFVLGAYVLKRESRQFWLLFWPLLVFAFALSCEIPGARRNEAEGAT